MAVEMAEQIGARMKARREELGLTQAEVALRIPGKAGGDQVSRWERGEHQPRNLEPIAIALEVETPYFYAPEPDKSVTPDLSLNGDGESQLDRIEAALERLTEKLDRLTPLLEGVEEIADGDDPGSPPASE